MSRRRLALRLALERRWQALYWRIVAAQALDSTSDKLATTGCCGGLKRPAPEDHQQDRRHNRIDRIECMYIQWLARSRR